MPSLYQMSPLRIERDAERLEADAREVLLGDGGCRRARHVSAPIASAFCSVKNRSVLPCAVVADLHLQRQARQRRGGRRPAPAAGGRPRRCTACSGMTLMPSNDPGGLGRDLRVDARDRVRGGQRDPDDAVLVDGDVAGAEDGQRGGPSPTGRRRRRPGSGKCSGLLGADRVRGRVQADDLVGCSPSSPTCRRSRVERLVERLHRAEAELEALAAAGRGRARSPCRPGRRRSGRRSRPSRPTTRA